MDLIEEQDRRGAIQVSLGQSILHHLANIFDPRGHRRELDEAATGGPRDGLGERRLPGAGRTPEDDGCRCARTAVGIGEHDQGRAGTQQMLLTCDLFERGWSHPHR